MDQPVILAAFCVTGHGGEKQTCSDNWWEVSGARLGEWRALVRTQSVSRGEPKETWRLGSSGHVRDTVPRKPLWLQCHKSTHLPTCPCREEGLVRVTTELMFRILMWIVCIALWKAMYCSGSSVLWFMWWNIPPKSRCMWCSMWRVALRKVPKFPSSVKTLLLFLCMCSVYANRGHICKYPYRILM